MDAWDSEGPLRTAPYLHTIISIVDNSSLWFLIEREQKIKGSEFPAPSLVSLCVVSVGRAKTIKSKPQTLLSWGGGAHTRHPPDRAAWEVRKGGGARSISKGTRRQSHTCLAKPQFIVGTLPGHAKARRETSGAQVSHRFSKEGLLCRSF